MPVVCCFGMARVFLQGNNAHFCLHALAHLADPGLSAAILSVPSALQAAKPATAQPEGADQQQSWSDKMKAGYAELKAEGTVHAPTIVYSSRTHSQLAQVMKELRNTSYRCAIALLVQLRPHSLDGDTTRLCECRPRCTVLGSRNQMCLHPTVSTLAGPAANQACRSLMQTRSCRWYA